MGGRDDVDRLIARLSPRRVCDDCIAERLGHVHRAQADIRTREIAGRDGIERRRDVCSLCFGDKMVIRRR